MPSRRGAIGGLNRQRSPLRVTVTTACKWDIRVDFDTLWRCVKRVLKPRGVFLTTASEPFASLLRVSNLDWYKYDWVWEKTVPTGHLNAYKQPMRWFELICIFASDEGKPNYYPQHRDGPGYSVKCNSVKSVVYGSQVDVVSTNDGTKYLPKDIIKFNNHNVNGKPHPTAKPVALYEYLIRTYTQPGDLVLDPFCGSGTTGLAALKTGRWYILGDSDAGYVEAARLRIQNADPYQPSDQGDGVTQLSLFGDDR